MKIQLITQNDCCEKVVVEYTPVEWLIANKALKQFRKNGYNALSDREIAENMIETEIEVEEQTGEDK